MKKISKPVIVLLAVSVLIYVAQILIFHDPRTTVFYILQDFAFMPVTVALVTIVLGDAMEAREKAEQREKTHLLTSTFFTNVGTKLLTELTLSSTFDDIVLTVLTAHTSEEDKRNIRDLVMGAEIHMSAERESYERICQELNSHRQEMLVIASNPMLLEHECFMQLLMGTFHLIDEFRIRGEYDQLSAADLEHMNSDFTRVFRLLLINWDANTQYMKKNFPDYFALARNQWMETHCIGHKVEDAGEVQRSAI